MLLANLVSINQVAITYQPAIEQLLVLLPLGTANLQAAGLADRNTKNPGTYIDFNLNINLPPACTTGFLPTQQMRTPQLRRLPRPTRRRPVLPDTAGLADHRSARRPQLPLSDPPRQTRADGQDV